MNDFKSTELQVRAVDVWASVAKAKGPSSESHGTAWLCGDKLALTALHVVPKDDTLELTFGNGTRAIGTLVDKNENFDVALLQLGSVEGTLGSPLRIDTDGFLDIGQSCRGFGYPAAYPTGKPVPIQIVGIGYDRGVREMHVGSDPIAAEEMGGISGGPILDANGIVVGLFCDALKKIDGALIATRMDDAWSFLRKWRELAPTTRSAGPVSQYFDKFIPIWGRPTYLARVGGGPPPSIDEIFVEPRFRTANARGTHKAATTMGVDALLAQLRSHDLHMVLRGEPGSGKSSLLRWICLDLAHAWHRGDQRDEVPVLVHATALLGTRTIDEAIGEIELFKQLPPAGVHWLVLIDGLDEIIDVEDRRIVMSKIKARFALGRSGIKTTLRLILATRPLALLDEISNLEAEQYVLKPFTTMQIDAFAHNWFKVGNPALADVFLEQLKISRLEGLVTTPALATVTAVVFDRSPNRTLPRSKPDLYDRYIELMLDARDNQVCDRFTEELQALRVLTEPSHARTLWDKRDQLLEVLATRVQLGTLMSGGDDFARAAVDWAFDRGLVARQPGRPSAAEQLHALFFDLVLSTGLIVAPTKNTMEFQQNSLREALVARAQAREAPCSTSEEIALFSRRWVEVRWREIVSLTLVRWSETGDPTRQAIWEALEPVLLSGDRGAHFVGTAVAEGVRLGSEAERIVFEQLLKRTEAWNPCGQLFSEFKSPNPADALRALTSRDNFTVTLVERLRADPEICEKKADALVQVAVDVASIETIAPLLQGNAHLARAASLVIGRAGRVDLVLSQLTELAIKERMEGDRLDVARIIGQEADAASLHQFLSNQEIGAVVRLFAALHSPRAIDEQQPVVSTLFGTHELDWTNSCHQRVARRALAVGLAPPLEKSDESTCLLFFRAAETDELKISGNVRRRMQRRLDREPAQSMQGLAIASILLEQSPTDDDLRVAQDRLEAFEGELKDVLDLAKALASRGIPAPLLDIATQPEDVGLSCKAASALWDAGFQKDARQILLKRAAEHTCQTTYVVDALFDIGENSLALHHCMQCASVEQNFIRTLRERGYAEQIAEVAKNPATSVACRRLAIGCLEYFGDYNALLELADIPGIPALLALESIRRAHELGWALEAEAKGKIIALRENLAAESLDAIESSAIDRHISTLQPPQAVLQWLSNESIWRRKGVFDALMERGDFSPGEVLSIYNSTGRSAPVTALKSKILGLGASCDTLRHLIKIALDNNESGLAFEAARELMASQIAGGDKSLSDLADSLDHVALALRASVARNSDVAAYLRLSELGRIADTAPIVAQVEYESLAKSSIIEIAYRVEAAVECSTRFDSPESEQTLPELLQQCFEKGKLADVRMSAVDGVLLFSKDNFPDAIRRTACRLLELPDLPVWARRALAVRLSRCGHFELALPYLRTLLTPSETDRIDAVMAAITLVENGDAEGAAFIGGLYALMGKERETEDIWLALRNMAFDGNTAEAVNLAMLVSDNNPEKDKL